MKALTREMILAASTLKRDTVTVPEWGGTIVVQEWSGAQRDAWEASLLRSSTDAGSRYSNLRARMVAVSVINEDGSPVFTESDVEALGRLSASALERVAAVVQRLNGLAEGTQDASIKNSEPGPDAG